MIKSSAIGASLLAALLLFGCATGGTQVTRTASDEVVDLSGRWNDTDSRLTAEYMVESMLSRPWLENFVVDEGKSPVVIVGSVRNRSSEHIETLTFIKDIERELVNSGRVTFVASAAEREEVREEREDQQSQATEETANRLAAETGADFMMQGTITSQTDAIEGQRVTLYKVDMELIHLENNQKVWIDTKEIKKVVEQSKTSW